MEINHNCVVAFSTYKAYCRFVVPKLFKFADSGRWDLIPARVRRYPAEAKFVHKYAPADTALHRLLRSLHCSRTDGEDSNDEMIRKGNAIDIAEEEEDPAVTQILSHAVKAILQASPAAACTQNLFGQTPLHLAVMDITKSRAAAAELLLMHTPMIATVRDRYGRTPLHYLAENKGRDSGVVIDLIYKFVEADSQALSRHDLEGKTPVALAVSHGNQLYADALEKAAATL